MSPSKLALHFCSLRKQPGYLAACKNYAITHNFFVLQQKPIESKQ